MLTENITTNDGTDDHTYKLVNRSGYNSIRVESGVSSALDSKLVVKNTLATKPSSPNRHLIQKTESELVEGELYGVTVNLTIIRDKLVSDNTVKLAVAQVTGVATPTNLDEILVGGN